MAQHHQVVLAAKARLLVAAKGAVRWVVMVVIDPHAAGLDIAACAVADVLVAGPYAGPKAEVGGVSDFDRLVIVLERSYGGL